MSISLFNDLARTAYHSSIMTTYSVDPAFYEGSIQYRLRSYGCENNILMTDALMLRQSLNAMPESFRSAGSRYAIVPIQVDGCFHPKIHLRLGRDQASLVIGSANATAAGWGHNQEILSIFNWNKNKGDLSNAAIAPLMRKGYDYLESWLAALPGESMAFKRNLHWTYSPWLHDLEPNQEPIMLPDGSAVDIFFDRADGKENMITKFARVINGDTPKRLIIISPYWDGNLGGLRELQALLRNCPTTIALNPDKNCFPIDALKADENIEFVSIADADNASRFLHAKMILVEARDYDHVLFGSTNCSDDALGTRLLAARNAETSIYRRVPTGSICEALGLDLSNVIPQSIIQAQRISSPTLLREGFMLSGGYATLLDKTLTWWPPEGMDGTGAEILIGEAAHNTKANGNRSYRTLLPGRPTLPLIIRIRIDKGVSDPIVVHDEVALRRASPGLIDQRLQKAFDRVLAGEDDIIDLAIQAHLIFSQDKELLSHAQRAPEKKPAPQEASALDYDTPEEFRQAIALIPATGDSYRFCVEDPQPYRASQNYP